MTARPSAADLLGASTLLLTALAVLYGVWYASIEAARDLTIPPRAGDAEKPLRSVRNVLRGRAYPLALASGLATAVFAPEGIAIVVRTIDSFGDHRLGAFSHYDPIEAALLFVSVGLAILTAHVGRLCLALRRKLRNGALLPA